MPRPSLCRTHSTYGAWGSPWDFAGRFSADLRNFNQVIDSPVANALTTAVYWVLPNLAPFDVRAQVVHGQPVAASYVMLSVGYAVLYVGALIVAAIAVFARRDFK